MQIILFVQPSSFLYRVRVNQSFITTMKFILGTKLGMTQVFREDGTVVPVTRVQAGPCVVTQVKTKKKDGVDAVQLGYGTQKKFRVNKAQQGHLKDLTTVRFMRDFSANQDHGLERGNEFTVKVFEPGEKVQVVGKSKGKGFQGVVKRHGFKGSPASHGHKDQLRMPGSIGATDAARVFKGTRMGGHMGDDRVTVKNLEIVEINPTDGELLIKGAVPGARGGLLFISTQAGKMEIEEATNEQSNEETTEVVNDKEAKEDKVEATKEEVKEEVVEAKKEQSNEEASGEKEDVKEGVAEVKKEVVEDKKEEVKEEKAEEVPSAEDKKEEK